ncbi:MAG: type VI secretion system baseplate subunit TssE, partial [Pseudomonadales bacterium]
DRDPDNNRESRDRRIISESNLRESVIRDLGWLLNTAHMAATEDLDDFAGVGRSVLNYGVPDLAGAIASSMDTRSLERGVREAIIRFEPRILADSLKIKVDLDKSAASHSALSFRIEADLWAQPMPLSMYLRTEMVLETGSLRIIESGR